MIDFTHTLRQWESEPGRIRIETPNEAISNAEFAARVRARAAELEALHVEQRSVVALTTGRGPGFFADLVAVWLVGGVAVPHPPERADEVDAMARPSARIDETLHALGTPREDRRIPQDSAAILFTSGSSGQPKGVVLSRRSLFGNANATVAVLPTRPDDRLLLNTPFHFTSAICHFLASLISDATLIAVEDKCFPQELVRCAGEHGATAFGGAPIQLRWLGEGMDPANPLRWWMSSGDHMPAQVVQQLTARFPDTSLHVFYGLTEVGGRFCSLTASKCSALAGSVGVPIGGMSLSVRDEHGHVLPRGVQGEVFANGEYLMSGYLGENGCMAPGPHGFPTGDVGHQDEDGNLWLLGRTDDVFKVAGQKVSGHIIAAALMETGLFDDVAVIPVEDEKLGAVPGACIVPRANPLEKSKLLRELRKRLPPNAIPRKFFGFDRIPRTGSGKVKLTRIQALLENATPL